MSAPWRINGPINGPEHPGAIAHGLKALHRAERRPPTEDDAPPVSTFPMTRAARSALAYSRDPIVTAERRRELTHGKKDPA